LRRAKVLLSAWEATSIIETTFDEAHVSEFELIGLLKSVVEKRDYDSYRITEIAAAVRPYLSLNRGPKVSAQSAAHEFLLQQGIDFRPKRRSYAGQGAVEIYVDRLTEATRNEFNHPDFDSRSACRPLRAGKARS
jgi:hypothetical protein